MSATWLALSKAPACQSDAERVVVVTVLHRFASHLLAYRLQTSMLSVAQQVSTVGYRHVALALTLLIDEHARQSLSFQDLVLATGVSTSHLSRLLRDVSGYGFATHLNCCRVLHAVLLLREQHVQVKQVAAAVGYESANELDRQFRRYLKMAPTCLRGLPKPAL